jgi:hypothetical protein
MALGGSETNPWMVSAYAFVHALRMIALRLDGILSSPLVGYVDALWKSTWLSVKTDRVEPDG